MAICWNRVGALACVLVATWLANPVAAAQKKPLASKPRVHAGAQAAPKPAAHSAVARQAKPHAATTARHAAKPRMRSAGPQGAAKTAVHSRRGPIAAKAAAKRHSAGKKTTRVGAVRATQPGAKVRSTKLGKRTLHKSPALRRGHKKTAH